ncbi:MAG TPA: transposase [Sulfolobales archaeon]|nr:transposase [Sulfolobales archaeon]
MTLLTRTIVVPSVELTGRKYEAFKELEEIYGKLVEELVDYGFSHRIKSFTGLKKHKYHELRGRYPQLPSHYIHTACQDASTRITSFLELKKAGLAKSEKPVVKKISVWLDDHLWKPLGHTAIKVFTHRGWINIELQPHKQYWEYVNNGWKLRTQPKLKIDHRRYRLLVHFIFEKSVDVTGTGNARQVVSVDINENNVTVKVQDKVFILQTDIKKLTVGYESYREVIQSIKGNRYVKRAIHGRERRRKRDIRCKVASIIVNTAKQLSATIVVENLPKQAPKNMISDVKDEKLRHRIYQAGFRGVLRAIEEKCAERGVPLVKVDPRNTSSTCPFCNSKLMRGIAPRQLKCPKCRVEMGRDVIAVLNIERRALKGPVPLGPMPGEPALEVAVLPMKGWARRKSLDVTMNEYK